MIPDKFGAENPFPGLRPYRFDENHLFFGFEAQIDELISCLDRCRFVAVVGPSGSGKSSLVYAGMLPTLFGGFMTSAGSDWRVTAFRPGTDPIHEMAEQLSNPAALGSTNIEEPALRSAVLEASLRSSSLGLVEAFRQARLSPGENLLIVVDQFEELFRYTEGDVSEPTNDEAAAFVKLLLEATSIPGLPVHVVMTMRSDFLGNCAQFRRLPEAINAGLYLIARMTRQQRQRAIEGPVAMAGAKIAPRLVQRMLNDVGDSQDQLPILQHALMRTWDEWAQTRVGEEPLDLQHYEAVGGITEALARHAEKIYAELPSGRSRTITEKLFQRITEQGPDNREIRQPTKLSEICAVVDARTQAVEAVINAFRRRGRSFLTPPYDRPLEPDSRIDVSHESFIRGWPRLKGWVEEEADAAQTYRRLAQTAALYEAGKAELLRGRELENTRHWRQSKQPNPDWARRYDTERALNFKQAMGFLQKSQRAAQIRRALFMTPFVILGIILAYVGLNSLQEFRAAQAITSTAQAVALENERNTLATATQSFGSTQVAQQATSTAQVVSFGSTQEAQQATSTAQSATATQSLAEALAAQSNAANLIALLDQQATVEAALATATTTGGNGPELIALQATATALPPRIVAAREEVVADNLIKAASDAERAALAEKLFNEDRLGTLAILANLLPDNLDQYDALALELFSDLSPEDQWALFQETGPVQDDRGQLAAAASTIYTTLMRDVAQDQRLLDGMIGALTRVSEHRPDELLEELNYMQTAWNLVEVDLKSAATFLDEAVSLNQSNPSTRWERAIIHAELQDYSSALDDLEFLMCLAQGLCSGEFWLGPPVDDDLRITSRFDDPRTFSIAPEKKQRHEGIDFFVMLGTPVLAAQHGVVDRVGNVPQGYGLYVRVRHDLPDGRVFVTWYAYMSRIDVQEGDAVSRGQTLGLSGNTGRAFGPVLHLTLQHIGNGLTGYVIDDVIDPEPFLSQPQPLPDIFCALIVTKVDGILAQYTGLQGFLKSNSLQYPMLLNIDIEYCSP